MSDFKVGIKKIGIHLLIILAITFGLLFTFFQIYLPSYTHHGESVTVPDLEGFHYDEVQEYLAGRNLLMEVTLDSGFEAEAKPLVVLKQNPKPGAKVKQERKIYVTLNAKNAPLIKMPNLVNTPLKNAQEIISNFGLVRGDIVYVPDIGHNAVLKQKYRGREIKEGLEIPKGSKIDLVVGDGLGNQVLTMPNIIGMDDLEAEFLILGSGLTMGEINYVETDTVPKGTVIKQLPPSGLSMRTGERVDVWVSKLAQEIDF
ncbi:PASTA domain-containing protein [Cyclobacterium marinum]|uniref:PASTA domain containing protein n=1 Tax=Cyclobacterium marinum (strain ATCC 25205 / DSM 745 / LMG 13164 / NCIMB 1802) TaxID=880070 RepID=G0IXJ8_CYCMS|nr:PASTA domain-containing protein [Cyclobacterium marinum]AEL27187.1 PASTA domain containing protein [Cyclobacterium marinum DSM 745]MBI0400436.1 PASTA domain-containing protein [Cyclobacterium marinum]MBR9775497.1 PASTA domain-containing protein [Cytophagales bacterium]|tara:strand:- start:42074 stop:42847 length:774 start_codon:yes stop_codon:yes gene_type:complete